MLSYLFATALILVAYYLQRRYKNLINYWKKQNVPYAKPWPIVGNFADYVFLRKTAGEVLEDLCEQFPNEPYFGVFYGCEPALVVRDPELIKQATTKDFHLFSSREISDYTHHEVFTTSMFFTYGDRWKILRQNFTPLFTTARMKGMFYLIQNCCQNFSKLLDHECQKDKVEMRSLMARFTMDCIGTCIFGIDTKVMESDGKDNVFRKMGDVIFEISYVRGFSLVARTMFPGPFYGLGFKTFPVKMDKFFHELLTGVFKARNYEPTNRNDFVDLLLNLTKNGYIEGDSIEGGKKVKLQVDDQLLVSQCLSFFAAGFDTTATTLSYTLYELAKDQESQRRAAEEVDEYLRQKSGHMDFTCVSDLPWTWACVSEALRMYPVLGSVTREAVSPVTFGGVKLRRTERLMLPVRVLHNECNDPQVYRPRRFMDDPVAGDRPPVYLAFGDGPRTCIGNRFARVMIMAAMVTVLRDYRVELAPGTPTTLTLDPKGLVTQPPHGIHLKLLKRII